MRNTTTGLAVVAIAALPLSSLSAQQRAPAPDAPPPPRETAPLEHPPGAYYLSEQYGISLEEASERIELQDEIAALVAQAKPSRNPDFAGIWVEHAPVFRIYIGYTDPDERKLLQFQIDPKIRRYVKLKKMPRSLQQAETDRNRLTSVLEEAGIEEFAVYVEEDTTDVVVEAPNAKAGECGAC